MKKTSEDKLVSRRTIKSECKVSVVCPFFNEQHIIEEATKMFKLLEEQFVEGFELILVDDGSTDKSVKILEKLLRSVAFKAFSCLINRTKVGRALKNRY